MTRHWSYERERVDKWTDPLAHARSCLALALALVIGIPTARAVEFSVKGISLSFFDEQGKITHKLNAGRASASGVERTLHEVEIVYFSANNPDAIVQRLEAAEAVWDEKKETLSGRGAVRVTTGPTRLTGEGFDFALASSRLHIHREFTLTNPEVRLASDRAVVDLLVERSRDEVKFRDVKRCEAIGNLVITVQPTATQKYPFDKAYSEIAVYEGAGQTITLPQPTRYERAGKPAGGAQTMVIELKEKR